MAVDTISPGTGALTPSRVPLPKVLAWALWDWGTQPVATVITTFVFSVYLTSALFGNKDVLTQQLGWAMAGAGILIALLAPVLGQGADRAGRRMFHLRWQTWLLVSICAAMYVVAPEPGYFWLGAVLLAAANLVAEVANVNYYSAIDKVSTPGNVGRISGIGWGMGYLGGIAILLLILGVLGSEFSPRDVRVSMLICAGWAALFTIPLFVALRDDPSRIRPPRRAITDSYRDLFSSVHHLARRSPNTLFFLASSALFRDGLAGVFSFGGILAAGTFGFTFTEVVIFGVVANVVAGVSTMLFGLLDDRVGPKPVILFSLSALVLLGIGVFAFHDGGKAVFWSLALPMCLFVGPAQSASRSLLARLIPEGRSGELFGLYATTGRAVSFLSPLMLAVAINIGMTVTAANEPSAQHWGILGIVAVLLIGLVTLLPVTVPGRRRS